MSLLPQRRTEERINRAVAIIISGTDATGSFFGENTITDNLSPTGLCLLITRPMTPGRTLLIKQPNHFLFTAEVRWYHQLDEGMYEIGFFLPFRTDAWQLSTG